jgi:hypothetical protein
MPGVRNIAYGLFRRLASFERLFDENIAKIVDKFWQTTRIRSGKTKGVPGGTPELQRQNR